MASVVSKLLYNLETLWLFKADISRLDAFHVKCLRCICKIPHSYISRVSNDTVFKVAQHHILFKGPSVVENYLNIVC